MSMRIQCPECAQRFTVESEIKGKMVECGACDHRFRVTSDVEVNKPKMEFKQSLKREHAPGEEPVNATMAGSLKPQKRAPEVEYQEPTRPVQILAGILAIFLTCVIWLVFIYGSRLGGALQDVDITRRFVLSGAFAAVILFLFIKASRRNVKLGVLLGLIFGGSLLIAPKLFEVRTTPDADDSLSDEVTELEDRTTIDIQLPPESQRPLYDRVGPKPVEAAYNQHGRDRVIGVLVTGADDTIQPQVQRYLKRRLKSTALPMSFGREFGEFYVVAPTPVDFEEALQIVNEIGTVGETDPNKRLFTLSIKPGIFDLPPQGALNSPSSPDFYRLNAEELRAFDHERVESAASRLAEVQPTQMRGDIRGRMIEKINQVTDAPLSFHLTLAKALTVWANDSDPEAVAAIEYATQKAEDQGEPVDRKMLVFLLTRNSSIGLKVLAERWASAPTEWETLYLQIPRGEGNEKAFENLITALTTGNINQKRSAASLLGTIGGPKAMAAMKIALTTPSAKQDVEFRVQLERSIAALSGANKAQPVPDAPDGDAPELPEP